MVSDSHSEPVALRTPPGSTVSWGGRDLSVGRLVPLFAVLLVLSALLATWCLSDVTLGEATRFIAYELCYTLLPGCLLYVLLSPTPGRWLRIVAIGWPCGYALEVGWFAITAALDVRAAFALLPLIVVAAATPYLFVRGRRYLDSSYRSGSRDGFAPDRDRGLDALMVAIAISIALVVLAFTFFAPAPLPANAHNVVYETDSVFDISLAAEVRHHWPITEPWAAGQPLHYYTGAFIHMAAINQVTGVALSTVVLRLLPSVMLLVVALQLWSLGRSIGRSRWTGPGAVVLLLVAEDINLDPTHTTVFHVNPFNQFSLSPSFAFGVPFFLGLLELIQSRLLRGGGAGAHVESRSLRSTPAGTRRALVMVALLVLGCGAAKTFAVADFIGGLGIFWLWYAIRIRPDRLLACCLALSAVCIGVIYLLMLAGGMASTLHVHPFDFATAGNTLARTRIALQSLTGHSGVWILLIAAGAPVITVCLLAPLIGAAWLLRSRDALSPPVVLLLSMFLAGVTGYVMLGAPGGVEGDFLVYGYIAMTPVAAIGLVDLWSHIPRHVRRGMVGAGACVFALGLTMAILTQIVAFTGHIRDMWYAFAYGIIAAGIVIAVVRRSHLLVPAVSSRLGRVVVCCIPLLVVCSFVKPATLTAVGAWKTVLHKRTSYADSSGSYGMTAALYNGLTWVREHTTSCDVLAVNNHVNATHASVSVFFYYSAFTERRVFLESWYYTPNGTRVAQPFPLRLKLNTEAISYGAPRALRELGEAGVSYVLVDKLHGGGAPEPASASRLVFSNRALDVYRLSAAGGDAHVTGRGCGTVTL
jgi:hypothetical protein